MKKLVLIIPRGEAVRNFVYSNALSLLSERFRIILLSVVNDEDFRRIASPYAEHIVDLQEYPERYVIGVWRELLHEAHFRWMDTEVARNKWETSDAVAAAKGTKIKRALQKSLTVPLASRSALEVGSKLENILTYRLRTTDRFDKFYAEHKPDLVFNASHIHGKASTLPVRVAKRMGIPVAGFVFSWDNLTNRSRIFEPYDWYFVWNSKMKAMLCDLYSSVGETSVFAEGTPQFDFHFDANNVITREELGAYYGIDPTRPFILYTTGIDGHFPEEHLHVQNVISVLKKYPAEYRPQLVVRTYVKGTGEKMKQLAAQDIPDVVFPKVEWDERWFTPKMNDLKIYTSSVHHCAMGINAASTVSLELMIHDKPIMNIGFDPPKSTLPHYLRWHRHIAFDHYQPVVKSGAVQVAYSVEDMEAIIRDCLENPRRLSDLRTKFIADFFDDMLDGNAAQRIAERLVAISELAHHKPTKQNVFGTRTLHQRG